MQLERSPVERVFAGSETIPTPFAEQFLLAPEDGHEVLLRGEMEEIPWPVVLAPLFALLGRFEILVPRRGRRIPSSLHVIPGRLPDGTPFHEWNRTFRFERPIRFGTTIVWDRRHQDLADLFGRPRLLRMVWAARYVEPGTFTLRSIANALTVRGRTVWLPRWLWKLLFGSVEFRQVAMPERGDEVTVDLRIVHPLLGTVFRYHGRFVPERVPRGFVE